MHIPIIAENGKILGWTDKPPERNGASLSHPEAERLVGGPIGCAYVQIVDKANAQRAGAPPEWNGPWRCLAICPDPTALATHSSGRAGSQRAHPPDRRP